MAKSYAFKQRQKTRKNGKYSEMCKCEKCEKAIGSEYYSLPSPHNDICKKLGIDGLILCKKCIDILNPQYDALLIGKEIERIDKKELTVKYVENLVLNGFDIAPFLFKEHKPTTTEMLNFVNEYSDSYLYSM